GTQRDVEPQRRHLMHDQPEERDRGGDGEHDQRERTSAVHRNAMFACQWKERIGFASNVVPIKASTSGSAAAVTPEREIQRRASSLSAAENGRTVSVVLSETRSLSAAKMRVGDDHHFS